jgi:DNA-directed RNA polymerase subunit RPC12/RpoP
MREIERQSGSNAAQDALLPLIEPIASPAGTVPATDEIDQFVEYFIRCLREGMCPTCNAEVDFMQKGIHVVGSCGHRMYVGLRPRIKRRKTATV